MTASQQKPEWARLRERLPWALILALAMQSAAALIWAGEVSARFKVLERRVEGQAVLEERTIRLQEQVSALAHALDRIEAKIDRMSEQGWPADAKQK